MGKLLLNDTSVLLNLLATDRLEEIVAATPWDYAICTAVQKETLRLYNPDRSKTEEVSLQTFIDQGVLEIWELEQERAQERYVQLASLMGDGEAMCFALAEQRSCAVAIDDRRAIRRAESVIGSVKTISTPEVLMEWENSGVTAQEMVDAITRIEFRARYTPGKANPCFAWWHAVKDN